MYIKIIGSGNESKNENNEKIFEKYKTSLFSSENNEILVLLKSKRIENIKNFSNHFSEEFNIPIK
jgi:N-glycosylase/DNA lyase